MAARALRTHLGRLPGCDRTSDFTIHDAEDGTSLLAGWVTEQLKAAAARNGARPDAKLVSFVTCTGPSPWQFKKISAVYGYRALRRPPRRHARASCLMKLEACGAPGLPMSTFGHHLKLQRHEMARFEIPIRVPVRRHERRRSAARNTAFCCLCGSSPVSTAWVAARLRQQGLNTTLIFVHMLPGQHAKHTSVAPHCLTGGACLHRSEHKGGADKGEGDAAAHLAAEKLAAMRLWLQRQGARRRCAEPRQRARCASRIGSFS